VKAVCLATLTVLAVAISLAGCDRSRAADTGADTTTPGGTTTPEQAEFAPVPVELYGPSGHPEGMANLADEGGRLTVTINLTEAPAKPRPANIHSGSCADLGDVVYPLANVEGGMSKTSVDVTLAELEGTEHAINVQMSKGSDVCGGILFG